MLREDFPRTAAAVGDEAFLALACRYLTRYPSTHPSVRHVGGRLAEFVAGEPSPPAMGEIERRAFPMLQRGESFAALCSAVDVDGDGDAAARQIGALLLRWLEDRLLARLLRPSPAVAPSRERQ